ncbi:MAG TPA: TIGR03118 family protein [Armatimonadota bacterium]|jgi:uncharacterized protein (TIGR03118 family)
MCANLPRRGVIAALLLASAVSAFAAASEIRRDGRHSGFYRQTNLISDIAGVALNTDPNLVNPWGIAFSPRGPIWVSDNGAGVSTVYDAIGNPLPSESAPLVVTIPPPAGSPSDTTSAPTGTVYNDSSDFVVSAGGKSGPARFLFATEDGTVAGWNGSVDGVSAVLAFDNSASGAVYKGLALGNNAAGGHIYLTNFHAGTVDVLDTGFHEVTLPGMFHDPNLPAGYAPFGIQNVGGKLFVTYALQDGDQHDDVSGPGHGYIDVYDTNGMLLKRFASGGNLNSPWGIAAAPRSFGPLGGSLLVGNFGDGRINAFDMSTGASRGPLRDSRGRPIAIDSLWGIAFGPSSGNRGHDDASPLYFTAGIAHEDHGLFGAIEPGNG